MDAAVRQASFKGRKKFFICFKFKMNPIKEQNYKKSANRTLFQANKFARGSKIFRARSEQLVFRE